MNDTVDVNLAAPEEPVQEDRPKRHRPHAHAAWGIDALVLNLDVQVHADKDSRRGWTCIYFTNSDGGAWSGSVQGDTAAEILAVFEPAVERLRELAKAEAVAAFMADPPAFSCLHGGYHRPGQCPEAAAAGEVGNR